MQIYHNVGQVVDKAISTVALPSPKCHRHFGFSGDDDDGRTDQSGCRKFCPLGMDAPWDIGLGRTWARLPGRGQWWKCSAPAFDFDPQVTRLRTSPNTA